MSEEISTRISTGSDRGSIEAEIAELSKRIDEKRKLLETEAGVVEEKEVVRQAVAEKISPSMPVSTNSSATATATVPPKSSSKTSYLDGLDKESVEQIQSLVALVFEKGFDAAIQEVSLMEPFIIDAFHDALVDRLYDELKSRGLVK